MIDDLGYGDPGCYGSDLHDTPHMDRLAREGVIFTDFHTNGPVCSPTRAALMTGQYQQRSGIESAIGFVRDEGMPLEKVTLAEYLKARGYTCGLVGKWHLGHVDSFGPNDQGFDFSYCSNNSPDYHSYISRAGEPDWYKNHELHEENGYITHRVEAYSNDFIEVNKDHPFFLFVSHPAVHFPFQGPGDTAFRMPGKKYHGNERIPGQVQPDSKYGPLPPEEYKRAYREMLEAVDDAVGSLVGTLEANGLRENTLIYLFHLARDPGEQKNLAEDNPELVEKFKQAYLRWEKEVTSDDQYYSAVEIKHDILRRSGSLSTLRDPIPIAIWRPDTVLLE